MARDRLNSPTYGRKVLERSDKCMVSNTEMTADGIEIYMHQIFRLADEYIKSELDGDRERVKDYFPDMLMYISDRIPKPDNADIELLDKIFDIYTRLCTKYRQLPTLEAFSWLVKINRSTFSDWGNGEYRSTTHSNTVKKWFDTCKSFAVNRLINKGGVDANLIFACKSAYGMVEAPVPAMGVERKQILSVDELPKLSLSEEEDI